MLAWLKWGNLDVNFIFKKSDRGYLKILGFEPFLTSIKAWDILLNIFYSYIINNKISLHYINWLRIAKIVWKIRNNVFYFDVSNFVQIIYITIFWSSLLFTSLFYTLKNVSKSAFIYYNIWNYNYIMGIG